MKRKVIASSTCIIMFVLAQVACADTTWNGSAGDFLWATPSNWDTGIIPVATDPTTIPSSSSPIQIASGETFSVAKFMMATTGNATLNVAGTLMMTNDTAYLPSDSGYTANITVPNGGIFNWSGTCYIGRRKGTGSLNISGGAVSASSLYVGNSAYGYGGIGASKGVVVADDFDLTLSSTLRIGDSYSMGYYTNRGGGEISCSALTVGATKGIGVLALESGKMTVSSEILVSIYGSSEGLIVAGDRTEIRGGKIKVGERSGDSGTLQLGAMTLKQTLWGEKIDVAYDAGTAKGMLELRGTTVTQAEAGDLRLGVLGAIIGYGSLTVGSYSHSTLDNGGLITASGFGVDQDLTFANYNMTQTTAGTGTNGWYAENGGRLVLPSVAISAGNSTNNLAETPAAVSLDLVNSVQVSLNTAVAGSLSYKLYAADRSDVPAGLDTARIASVWKLSAPSFSSAALTFKLPNIAAEDDMKLVRYTGYKWVEVGTVDVSTDFATATDLAPLGTDNLGFFAVAFLPPPKVTVIIVR